ncbi:hypothetical protein L596_011027 [Steinernema carpocapsae]|uniref:Uncharacterized protein n=1 Tax=Steinernema carpocapsae TaxID=34508 RepID=A0A4U5NTF4_STECR|nr:hypothetical protein L596_011027 [Steinernema carpocapsae]
MSSKIKNANNEIANSPPLAIKSVVTKTTSNGSGSGPLTPRGSKTLGWFLSEALADKEPVAPLKAASPPPAPASDTASSTSSVDEKKKSRRGKNSGQRGKKVNLECLFVKKRPGCVGPESYNEHAIPEDKLASANKEQAKEDYWYYDPVSDGFYYEQNGSRGWRKRMPANVSLSRAKPFDAMEKLAVAQQQAVAQAQAQAQVQAQSQGTAAAAAATTNPQFFTPAIKYYDAVSDGYFYEMASVDGWKKRQPHSSSQSSTSSSSAPMERENSVSSHGHHPFDESEEKTLLPLLHNLPPYLKNTYKNPMDMIICQSTEKPNSVASSSSFSDEPSNYYWPKSSVDEALPSSGSQKPFSLPLADDSDDSASSSSSRNVWSWDVDRFIQDMNFNAGDCGTWTDSSATSPP